MPVWQIRVTSPQGAVQFLVVCLRYSMAERHAFRFSVGSHSRRKQLWQHRWIRPLNAPRPNVATRGRVSEYASVSTEDTPLRRPVSAQQLRLLEHGFCRLLLLVGRIAVSA